MLRTRFTDLVGCAVPVQQAPIGLLGIPPLAKAVADAGGLGMLSVTGIPLDMAGTVLDELAETTPGVFGGNIIPCNLDRGLQRKMTAITAQRARVVDFFYSDPDPVLVEIAHAHGALASWQVGSREEALAAVDAGCDFIIAQGIAAGGHVRGEISLLPLLDEVLEAVDVPVLAAGGIGSGRSLAAVLAAGADGARIGTRFVAASEAGAHPDYLDALSTARAVDTVYTDAFEVGWPEAPHRVLRSCLEAARAFEGDVVGEGSNYYTGATYPIQRFHCNTVGQAHRGTIAAMSLWAGESVGRVQGRQPAAEIIRELVDDAERRLHRFARPRLTD